MKSLRIILLSLGLFLMCAQFASAISWIPIVPCGITRPGPESTDPPLADSYYQDCNKCELFHLANNLIDFLFQGLVPIGSALAFTIAGLMYMMGGAQPKYIDQAKGIFQTTVGGIIVMSLAWLITDTIIRNIVHSDITSAYPWDKFECTVTVGIPPSSTPTPSVSPTTSVTPLPGGTLTDAAARQQLSAVGITVNHPEPQTSLKGIRQATLAEVINLKGSSNCPMIVTGGTETTGGHAGGTYSHLTGYKLDIGFNVCVDGYVTTHGTSIGNRSGDNAPQYQLPSGAIYAKESNHWDILVK